MNANWTEFYEAVNSTLREQVIGDPEPYKALWSHTDDVAIMGADGSLDRGWEATAHGIDMAASVLKAEDRTAEPVMAVVGDDVAITVDIESVTKKVGDNVFVKKLRCTHAYRRENGEWKIVLRHADELNEGGPKRGEGPPGGGPPGGGPPGGGPPGGGPPGGGPPGGGPPGGGPPGGGPPGGGPPGGGPPGGGPPGGGPPG